MKVSGPGINSVFLREVNNTRTQMTEVQTQIGSGKVASTYGGLGNDRTVALSLQQQMSAIGAYRNNITQALPRVQVMSKAVDGMRDIASSTRSSMLFETFDVKGTNQTLAQRQAKVSLGTTIDLLNSEIGGRHLFSGTAIDQAPVVSSDEMLNGVGGQAGFIQVMNERRQADLGADGLGRLVLNQAGPAVSLAEDAAGSPFGFKLTAANSGLSGTTVSGPTGSPPAIGVSFSATLPQKGETIALSLALPDGGSTEIKLKAITSGTPAEGEFLVGADANATAANFGTALQGALTQTAGRTLAAASMEAAANDFFTSGSDVPQRVAGPPFTSATALRDATDSDTVRWYKGEVADTPASETALARIDDNQFAAYGARADEGAFSTLVKQLAVMSSAQFDASDKDAYNKYSAFTSRVADQLGFPDRTNSLDRKLGELAIAESSLSAADERHSNTDDMLTSYLADIETTDINAAGAKLLSLQTQLQASYQVTSMLSKLTLVNYL
jgi:flagellin-like hook-associated protein FlgL